MMPPRMPPPGSLTLATLPRFAVEGFCAEAAAVPSTSKRGRVREGAAVRQIRELPP